MRLFKIKHYFCNITVKSTDFRHYLKHYRDSCDNGSKSSLYK